MKRWTFVFVLLSLWASAATYGRGRCGGDLYPNPPNNCYPCLGCMPCCSGCSDFCQDPSNRAFLGYGTDQLGDIRFGDDNTQWKLISTAIGGEYRPRRFTFANSWIDPSVSVGVGTGTAELTVGRRPLFDDDVTMLDVGTGLHWSHWNNWGADLDVSYRKLLDSGTTTQQFTSIGTVVNSVDFAALTTALSLRYDIIPGRLSATAGVRTTDGDVILEQRADDGEFISRESADFDRRQFVAGAEVRFNRALSVLARFAGGSTAVSLRYGFGRGRQVPSSIPRQGGEPVELGCAWRGFRCNQPGFGCLVMFPENEWRVVAPQFADGAFVTGKGEVTGGGQPVLRYEFSSSPSVPIPTFEIDEAVTLSASTSRVLGFETVTILPGTYSVDPRIGQRGGIVYNVRVSVTNAANPQDAFGQLHNEGIRHFRAEFPRHGPAKTLTTSEFAAVFHEVMLPWVRTTSRDPRYLTMASISDPEQAFADMKTMLDRIRDDAAVRELLRGVPPEANDASRRIDTALRRLDAGCSDLPQYRQELRAIEAEVLSQPGGTDVLSARITSLARHGASLYERDAQQESKSFPWKDVLGGDLNGASTGAWIGGVAGPGGAAAGGVLGGLTGSALALYEHGYIRD